MATPQIALLGGIATRREQVAGCAAGRQRHVLAELKDWDPSCGIATPSAASAIFFLSSVVSGVGERRRRELRNLNGLFEIFVAVSSRSPRIRSAKISEGSGDESRFD
jgi:hypothetical protein